MGDEIDGDSLTPKAAASAYSMHINLLVLWKVVVDDDGDLLNIDTTGQHVSRDQNPSRAQPEILETGFTILCHAAKGG